MGWKKLTNEIVAKRSELKHGKGKIDFSLLVFEKSTDIGTFICSKHGKFNKEINAFLQSPYGCAKCGHEAKNKNTQISEQEYYRRVYLNQTTEYDYSKSVYIGFKQPIEIICPTHGSFWQIAEQHSKGRGCKKCADAFHGLQQRKTLAQFIKEAQLVHGDTYDYSLFVYTTANISSMIICPVHGEFPQTPAKHLGGQGCPTCRSSKGEKEIFKILTKMKLSFKTQESIRRGNPSHYQRFDFYLPDYDLYIEYQGIQHYEPVDHFGGFLGFIRLRQLDLFKVSWCYKQKHNLLTIKYTNFNKMDAIIKRKLKLLIKNGKSIL